MALTKADLFEIEAMYRFEAEWLRKQVPDAIPGRRSPVDESLLRRADKMDRGADLIMGMQGLDRSALDRVMAELRAGYKVMAAPHDRAKAAEPIADGAAA